MASKVLVLDNGGCAIKAGYAGQENPKRITPNALARGKRDKKLYVGEKILGSPLAEYILARPSQKGLVLDWECQKLIWENGLFVRDKSGQSFNVLPEAESSTLVVTIAQFTPNSVKREMLEVLFKDYRFNRVVLIESTLSAQFSPGITSQFTKDDWDNPCGLIIDVGFSATTIVPVFNTLPVLKASLRIPVAGRVLNNLLRERLAYLQVDLDDNPLLIQHIKESVCRVAPVSLPDALNDLKRTAPNDSIGYVLPNFSTPSSSFVGRVVDTPAEVPQDSQAVKIGADRFAVPEALFNPLSFGIDKLGLVEAVTRSVSKCDACIRDAVARKIIVVGGTVLLPGFLQRFQNELESALRTVAHVDAVRLLVEPDGRTDLSVWRGASQLASSEENLSYLGAIYREEWDNNTVS
jgi:actin-related protein 6